MGESVRAVFDSELETVAAFIKAADPSGQKLGDALRRTFDMLLDGQNTGRYRWDQLRKTEKTHCGTLAEINVQRELDFDDGDKLDYLIAGIDVDCKYSQDLGKWMIPPEARGHILLGLWASDVQGIWSAGLIRATDNVLTTSDGNRDKKGWLTAQGRASVRWLFRDSVLPENLLLHMPDGDVEAIMECCSRNDRCQRHGAGRVRELFRRAQGKVVRRAVVATVARQDDFMKRARGNGGARTSLRDEGIVIFGHEREHAQLAQGLGLPGLRKGELVSARLASKRPRHEGRPFVSIDGSDWVVALPDDPEEQAPVLPKTTGRES